MLGWQGGDWRSRTALSLCPDTQIHPSEAPPLPECCCRSQDPWKWGEWLRCHVSQGRFWKAQTRWQLTQATFVFFSTWHAWMSLPWLCHGGLQAPLPHGSCPGAPGRGWGFPAGPPEPGGCSGLSPGQQGKRVLGGTAEWGEAGHLGLLPPGVPRGGTERGLPTACHSPGDGGHAAIRRWVSLAGESGSKVEGGGQQCVQDIFRLIHSHGGLFQQQQVIGFWLIGYFPAGVVVGLLGTRVPGSAPSGWVVLGSLLPSVSLLIKGDSESLPIDCPDGSDPELEEVWLGQDKAGPILQCVGNEMQPSPSLPSLLFC